MTGRTSCPHCGEALTANGTAAECPACGQTLENAPAVARIDCPMCGTPQPGDARRCTHCGEDLNVRPAAMRQSLEERFARELQAAGLFWTVLGLVSLTVLMQILTGSQPLRPHPAINTPVGVLTLGLLGISGGGFLLFGGLMLARKRWAVHGGLWLSYVCLAGCLMDFNICAGILYLLGVLVGHKVLRQADKLGVASRGMDQPAARD